MADTLDGKVALVTGSARGVGFTMAEHLAREGAAIALHYRTSQQDALASARKLSALGARCEVFQADLMDPRGPQDLVSEVQARLGGLDVLINNVGDYLKKDILEVTGAEWRTMLDSNLNSAFDMCQAAIPGMREKRWGRILQLGFAGCGNVMARTQITPYFIAKQGLLVLTKTLARRLAKEGITVNMVSPGILETSVDQPLQEIPMGRLARLDEFVAAVAYLVSPKADYVTGQNLEVAGGWGA